MLQGVLKLICQQEPYHSYIRDKLNAALSLELFRFYLYRLKIVSQPGTAVLSNNITRTVIDYNVADTAAWSGRQCQTSTD